MEIDITGDGKVNLLEKYDGIAILRFVITHLKLNQAALLCVLFFSLGIFSCLGGGKEIVKNRFGVRVFLEINNRGRKVRELRNFLMELVY